eukprot:2436270-Amphidinium_carterae.1
MFCKRFTTQLRLWMFIPLNSSRTKHAKEEAKEAQKHELNRKATASNHCGHPYKAKTSEGLVEASLLQQMPMSTPLR